MNRILVVDDESLVRSAICSMLWDDGFAVSEASDGTEALNEISNSNPKLVITDIFMPRTDGLELIREIRRSHSSVRVIAIAGREECAQTNYLDIALKFGASRSLWKPVDNFELLQSVRTLALD